MQWREKHYHHPVARRDADDAPVLIDNRPPEFQGERSIGPAVAVRRCSRSTRYTPRQHPLHGRASVGEGCEGMSSRRRSPRRGVESLISGGSTAPARPGTDNNAMSSFGSAATVLPMWRMPSWVCTLASETGGDAVVCGGHRSFVIDHNTRAPPGPTISKTTLSISAHAIWGLSVAMRSHKSSSIECRFGGCWSPWAHLGRSRLGRFMFRAFWLCLCFSCNGGSSESVIRPDWCAAKRRASASCGARSEKNCRDSQTSNPCAPHPDCSRRRQASADWCRPDTIGRRDQSRTGPQQARGR